MLTTAPRLLLTMTMTVLALAATACSDGPKGEPIGFDVVAGTWEGPGVSLAISDTGTIHYDRQQGTSTKLDGLTITELTTTGFDVKLFGIGTHFKIDALPHDVNGEKKMTVDGTELTLQAPAVPADAPVVPAVPVEGTDAPSGPAPTTTTTP